MKKRHIAGAVAAAALFTTVGGVGATAADLIGGKDIAGDAIASRHIADGTIRMKDISDGAQGKLQGTAGPQGPAGAKGEKGDKGAQGPQGEQGESGVLGAYYAVAFYNAGDTNAGAIATVACKATTDVAISGGVQVLGIEPGANTRNTPVSSSFPGRMDWTTSAPRPDRLDGWIVQFGGNAGEVQDRSPLKTKIWALCVPGASIPVEQTYAQVS
ncbi:hypothetical protein F4692_000141 [Nocardioides cavernae]|uniref:Collagen-like protein n=1 Tax=Nocardioides cavernae TaxID=1921566 RepID=A0A7Y9KR83_9ACTN|nr:collagen-like protein [Nocardioides cavernae]NYE35037.1 hypothetical protein [Nocardioides cavernae]